MATVIRRFRVNHGQDTEIYLPSPKEIAEKTAEIREARLKRKLAVECELEEAALNRLDMTKDDICNVESITQEELLEALRMSKVEEVDNRWASTQEGEL